MNGIFYRRIFACLCKPYKYVASMDMAKFSAGFKGLCFALEAGFYDVVLKGESLTVITILLNGQIELVNAGVIIVDMLDLSNLCTCSFSFVKPCNNSIAHMLARFALFLDDDLI